MNFELLGKNKTVPLQEKNSCYVLYDLTVC